MTHCLMFLFPVPCLTLFLLLFFALVAPHKCISVSLSLSLLLACHSGISKNKNELILTFLSDQMKCFGLWVVWVCLVSTYSHR